MTIEKTLPKVAIVVLNWNGAKDTIECLESLRRLRYPDYHVIVVDNGSTDDSRDRIEEWMRLRGQKNGSASLTYRLPSPSSAESQGIIFEILPTNENLGFSGGNNRGLQAAMERGDRYFWVLNNDTICHEDALIELMKGILSEPHSGMVGSKLLSSPDFSSAGESDHSELCQDVPWLSAASLLVSKETLDDVGLLDEAYFLYGEDVDWSFRAHKKKWRTRLCPSSLVYHKEGRSTRSVRMKTNVLGQEKSRLHRSAFLAPLYYESRNGIYFMKKFHKAWVLPYAFLRTAHLVALSLVHDQNKKACLQALLEGARDGLRGKMGMTVDPRDTRWG